MHPARQPRYAPALALPAASYVPGHGLPHPVSDPAGHLHARKDEAPEPPLLGSPLAALPTGSAARGRALSAALATNPRWRYSLDLFNGGWYWEAHESWEEFWHALGRTTPEARFVQGLIHLAAACVKAREGKPNGVGRHTARARDLLRVTAALGVAPDSVAAVVAELEAYKAECWHASRAAVVRIIDGQLRLAEDLADDRGGPAPRDEAE